MRHVILVNGIWPSDPKALPEYYNRSIAPYQLRNWLSQFNIRCQVLDYFQLLDAFEMRELVDRFVGPETKIVGFSTSFWPGQVETPRLILHLISYLRDTYPEMKIVAGGARRPKDVHLFDEVFTGESEDRFTGYCQYVLGQGQMTLFNKRFNITELEHRFQPEDAILPNEVLPIELGRGCIFKCKFCSHHNLGKAKHTYQRAHNLLLDEMRYNAETFGTTRYNFLDDTVNEDTDKVERLSQLPADLGFPIEWVGYLRADLLWAKPSTVDQLRLSGLRSCLFGIETFNQRAGNSIDKGWAARQGKDYLPRLYHDLWGQEINISVSLIVGLPHESEQSLRETLQWCKKNSDLGWHRFNALTLYTEKKDEAASSEFTRNHHLYGYTSVDATGYWENDHMNSDQARGLAQEFNKELRRTNRLSSWYLFSALNLGLTIDKARNLLLPQYFTYANAMRASFKFAYMNALRNVRT